MKRRDLSFSLNNIFDQVRGNIFSFILIIGLVFLVDYRDVFGGSNEIYYVLSTTLVLFVVAVIINKYRNPFQYHPHYVFFVKDRNDPMVNMKPFIDPLIIKLGLIKPEEFVNVRYSMYPDLDMGLDLDPNTGFITGFAMERGNHASEIKMQYLGGEYSTTVRVEVVDTLKEKMIHQRDEFAPPRTVAQLLVREEDLLKREQDLDYDMSQRQAILEEEYKSKELTLNEQILIEKEEFEKKLAHIKNDYQLQLKQKDSKITNLNKEMESKLKELKEDRNQKIDKLEVEMIEALQNKEREFVDFEKETKLKLEEKKRELEESYKAEEEPEEEVVEEEPVEEEPEEEVVEEEPVEEEPEEEPIEEESEEEPEEAVIEEEWIEEKPEEANYDSMTVPQLKKLLKEKGLPVSGKKEELISRLRG